jgi:hypothetical protein
MRLPHTFQVLAMTKSQMPDESGFFLAGKDSRQPWESLE